jgi:hypothetical protein
MTVHLRGVLIELPTLAGFTLMLLGQVGDNRDVWETRACLYILS